MGRSETARSSLSVSNLLFIDEYLRNGRNGTRAYKTVHPKASLSTSATQASRLLDLPKITQELAHRIRYDGGITRELVESDLLFYRDLARQKEDYLAGATIAMDCAKLAGFLIEKRQEVSSPPILTPDQLTTELHRRGFLPVPCN